MVYAVTVHTPLHCVVLHSSVIQIQLQVKRIVLLCVLENRNFSSDAAVHIFMAAQIFKNTIPFVFPFFSIVKTTK